MATEQCVAHNNYIKENEASIEKWKSSSEAIDESEKNLSGGFDCNICLDTVQDPVVTLCGHLYCWPCIYKWIHRQNTRSKIPNKHNPQCPVCKTEISQNTLVPLYVPNETTKPNSDKKGQDLGMLIPRRPTSPSCEVYTAQTQAPGLMTNVINPTSATTTIFGEMVYERIFGNTETTFYAYPNSYNLTAISTQRARRQALQADMSLGRIWFFLFCCMMLCLLLF